MKVKKQLSAALKNVYQVWLTNGQVREYEAMSRPEARDLAAEDGLNRADILKVRLVEEYLSAA